MSAEREAKPAPELIGANGSEAVWPVAKEHPVDVFIEVLKALGVPENELDREEIDKLHRIANEGVADER